MNGKITRGAAVQPRLPRVNVQSASLQQVLAGMTQLTHKLKFFPGIHILATLKRPNLTSMAALHNGSYMPTEVGLYWRTGAILARCPYCRQQ